MNLFQLPTTLPEEERTDVLTAGKNWRLERIVSAGQKSPADFWYDQEEDEWVCLLTGEAIIGYEDGQEIHLKAGDHLFIPRRQKHQVRFTSKEPPAIWLCFFIK